MLVLTRRAERGGDLGVSVDPGGQASPTHDPRDVARIKPILREMAAQIERSKDGTRGVDDFEPAFERAYRAERVSQQPGDVEFAALLPRVVLG